MTTTCFYAKAISLCVVTRALRRSAHAAVLDDDGNSDDDDDGDYGGDGGVDGETMVMMIVMAMLVVMAFACSPVCPFLVVHKNVSSGTQKCF